MVEEECRQSAHQVEAAITETDFLVRYGYAVDDVRVDCEWHDKKPPSYDEPQPDFLDLERLGGRAVNREALPPAPRYRL